MGILVPFFFALLLLQTFSPRLEFDQTPLVIDTLSNLQSLKHFSIKNASFFHPCRGLSIQKQMDALITFIISIVIALISFISFDLLQ